MKTILSIALLLAFAAYADDAAFDDRLAIDRAISGLNFSPAPEGLFADDATSDLGRLPEVKSPAFRILKTSVELGGPPLNLGRPVLVISKEPWGEAQLLFPGDPRFISTELTNPRITGGKVPRFVTSDVALVEGSWTYQEAGSSQTIPLLFVMKKEGERWKIASVRMLASR